MEKGYTSGNLMAIKRGVWKDARSYIILFHGNIPDDIIGYLSPQMK